VVAGGKCRCASATSAGKLAALARSTGVTPGSGSGQSLRGAGAWVATSTGRIGCARLPAWKSRRSSA
jgi:hypothetical protein